MTRVSASETVSKPKASSSTYPLRGHPTKSSPVKSSQVELNLSPTATPLTPSRGKCSVCQGIEEIRSYNLKEAVQEFSSKLESYVELSKSLGENSSNLKHAIPTIKHSILHLDPKVVENHFTSVDNKITTVADNLADLSNYITKLDTIHQITESTKELIHSNISNKAPDKSMEAIDSRLHKQVYRCYSNGRDNIHLGAVGIRVLTGKIKSALSLTDTRSYAYAVRTT